VFYDEQKEMVENGSGAIRALSRTNVLLIAADPPAAVLCKEFLAGLLSKENYSTCGGRRMLVLWPIGPS
jgi:hypothetical protein